MDFSLRGNMFRIWYWYVNRVDKNAEILFMNYGYSEDNQEIKLEAKDQSNRYSIQLYHHLASKVDLKNKDLVEIGCGRGGGLYYIMQNFHPATAIGVELDQLAVNFCNGHYQQDGLSFLQGDAQKLDLENASCDYILNVESSHRYADMKSFLSEVHRILRPGGHFLFTDFRYSFEMDQLKNELIESGLEIIQERVINKEVVKALELDDPRKRMLVKKLTPKFLSKVALNFGGTIGSETYNQFVSKKYIYFSYILRKN